MGEELNYLRHLIVELFRTRRWIFSFPIKSWSKNHHTTYWWIPLHYNAVIMRVMASQITSLTIVNSTVYPGAVERKHQIPASLAFVRGIHRWPVNSPHKGPVTRKKLPFDDVNMSVLLPHNNEGPVKRFTGDGIKGYKIANYHWIPWYTALKTDGQVINITCLYSCLELNANIY